MDARAHGGVALAGLGPEGTAGRPADLRAPARRTTLVKRLARCMGVSVVTTTISLLTLAFGTLVLGMAAWTANVLATALATGPSYHLNRRWTWGRRDSSELWREILPFWLLSFTGLVFSTVAVGLADVWARSIHLAPALHTPVLLAAHMSGFGVLWIVQFIFLERVLFGRETGGIRWTAHVLPLRAVSGGCRSIWQRRSTCWPAAALRRGHG